MKRRHPAVEHYGNWPAVADALGISRQAIGMRKKQGRPMLTRIECLALETLTRGELRHEKLLRATMREAGS